MNNVLIASNSSSTMNIISDLLRSESFERIVTTQNGSEARRYISDVDFDLVIIDTPLPDEFGDDLSLTAAEQTTAGIILIVQTENVLEVGATVENYGVFAVPKPVSSEFFYQAVKLLEASRKRVHFLENENHKLQKKIEEIRLVDRAKLILVQVLKMTESQAQHYIERQSMDLRQTRVATAENILRTYEQ